jgi:hypothetical protein
MPTVRSIVSLILNSAKTITLEKCSSLRSCSRLESHPSRTGVGRCIRREPTLNSDLARKRWASGSVNARGVAALKATAAAPELSNNAEKVRGG